MYIYIYTYVTQKVQYGKKVPNYGCKPKCDGTSFAGPAMHENIVASGHVWAIAGRKPNLLCVGLGSELGCSGHLSTCGRLIWRMLCSIRAPLARALPKSGPESPFTSCLSNPNYPQGEIWVYPCIIAI